MTGPDEPGSLERLVERARGGDRGALEAVVRAVQDRVYALAIRMLGDPTDAEDAAQEILIRVVTGLSSFRGESRFSTWLYQVAANHLLTTRKRRAESVGMSFDALGGHIEAGLAEAGADAASADPVYTILAEEVRSVCTEGMLLSLDREHRLAFLLGEILELPGEEAAAVLEVSPDAFRKRLQRARAEILAFVSRHCGVFDASRPCRCRLQVPYTRRTGMLDPTRLRFANHPVQTGTPAAEQPALRELTNVLDVGALHRLHPDYAAPESLVAALRSVLGADEPR